MKIETKEVYKCEYCNKLYQIKRFAERHELMCKKNPNNARCCFGCSFLKKKKTTYYYSAYGEEFEIEKELLHCEKIDSFLYPPKVEYKENWFDLDELNQPMRRQCEFFKEFQLL